MVLYITNTKVFLKNFKIETLIGINIKKIKKIIKKQFE